MAPHDEPGGQDHQPGEDCVDKEDGLPAGRIKYPDGEGRKDYVAEEGGGPGDADRAAPFTDKPLGDHDVGHKAAHQCKAGGSDDASKEVELPEGVDAGDCQHGHPDDDRAHRHQHSRLIPVDHWANGHAGRGFGGTCNGLHQRDLRAGPAKLFVERTKEQTEDGGVLL